MTSPMDVTVAIVRVYASEGGYGDPREVPAGFPLTMHNRPSKPYRTIVALGAPLDWVLEAVRLRRVVSRTALTGQFGRANSGQARDPEIDQLLVEESRELGPDGHRWWITVAIEKSVEVSYDTRWSPRPYLWIDPQVAEGLEARIEHDGSLAIDAMTETIATVLPNEIAHVVIPTTVVFRADGKHPFVFPKLGLGTPSLHVSSPMNALDTVTLSRRLRKSGEALRRVPTVTYWVSRARNESDPWKKYAWLFLAIEVLTNKLATDAQRYLRQHLAVSAGGVALAAPPELLPNARSPLGAKFAQLALLLAPDDAVSDSQTFGRLKDVRDRLSHGDIRDPDELPVAELNALVTRYAALAIAHITS